jgi:L-ascorbate oxidase
MARTGTEQVDIHPWHVHGANFYDMGLGSGQFTPTKLAKILSNRNPVQRDTTVGYSKMDFEQSKVVSQKNETPLSKPDLIQDFVPVGWRAVRFKADNPGVWMVGSISL